MPYRITWEQNGVYCQFWGEVEAANVIAMLRDISSDGRFDTIHYWLTDYLDVTHQHIVAEEVDEMIALEFAHHCSNSRYYAVAVANDAGILALLRYWTSHHPDQNQLAYFTTVEEARAWIAAQPPILDQKRRFIRDQSRSPTG